MLITILLLITSFFIILIFYKNKYALKKNKNLKFNKKNFYKWMNLTKKERFELAKSESNSYFRKRQNLLENIRKEYKDISKK